MSGKLSHVDEQNRPKMVDVSSKPVSLRKAHARAVVRFPDDLAVAIENGEIHSKKGPVFQTAIIAGVMAAKKTHELIPFCHPLAIEKCDVDIRMQGMDAIIDCEVSLHHKTGVEMEALTGASVAALTVYDMCKALSHDLVITETRLIEKTGGKSDFHHENP